MRVVAGTDDVGDTFDALLEEVRRRRLELKVVPRGDWPVVAQQVGESVAAGDADMGLLMCWTGTGTSIMANKVPGIRAALCWEPWIAENARRWNDANVLVMSLQRISPETALEILDAWLAVERPDEDEIDNIRRIADYEGRNAPKSDPIRS